MDEFCAYLLNLIVVAAKAMQELKLSLEVPQRMGWNGDPCAPTRWDAWEGVTCNFTPDNSGLVVTHMYGPFTLKGSFNILAAYFSGQAS